MLNMQKHCTSALKHASNVFKFQRASNVLKHGHNGLKYAKCVLKYISHMDC